MIPAPQMFVTFSPENVEWRRKATLTYTKQASSMQLLEERNGLWVAVATYTGDLLPMLAKIRSWCEGE